MPVSAPVGTICPVLLAFLPEKSMNAFHLNRLSMAVVLLHGATAPSGPGLPHYQCLTITLRHTTLGRTTLDQ
jgi:hypothetical protein